MVCSTGLGGGSPVGHTVSSTFDTVIMEWVVGVGSAVRRPLGRGGRGAECVPPQRSFVSMVIRKVFAILQT